MPRRHGQAVRSSYAPIDTTAPEGWARRAGWGRTSALGGARRRTGVRLCALLLHARRDPLGAADWVARGASLAGPVAFSQPAGASESKPSRLGIRKWQSSERTGGARRLRRRASPWAIVCAGIRRRRLGATQQRRNEHHSQDESEVHQPEDVNSAALKLRRHPEKCYRSGAGGFAYDRLDLLVVKPRDGVVEQSSSALDEPPRKLRRGPPITLTCECGERRDLRYGERWQCEKCGRTWDTNRIPAEEYAAIIHGKRRQVFAPLAVTLLVGLLVLYLVLEGRAVAAIMIVPMVGYGWAQFIRPARRRRHLRELSELPRWQIKPE
jgi:hypothetical protein